MKIQRYNDGIDSIVTHMAENDRGEYVKFTDHEAAMREQHERDLRFAKWCCELVYGFGGCTNGETYDGDMGKAFKYWEKEIEPKEKHETKN